MTLTYNMWSEDDIKSRNVVDEGDYPFEIINITIRKTKSKKDAEGNQLPVHDMMEIDFSFFDNNGVVKKLKDWIVFMDGMDWKLRHVAEAVGLLDLYEERVLDTYHLIKKKGVFTLGVRENEYNGQKKKMNYIKDYIKIGSISPNIDEDIPL